jgi:deoxyadenosine/deoxycytidine kinase
LLIYLYLDTDQLQRNIQKRGRVYELEIKTDYLEQIQNRYLAFLKGLPNQKILIIDMQGVDFVNDKSKFEQIIQLLLKDYPKGITNITLD